MAAEAGIPLSASTSQNGEAAVVAQQIGLFPDLKLEQLFRYTSARHPWLQSPWSTNSPFSMIEQPASQSEQIA
ncbi:MAG: hypothetical protein ACRDRJ_48165 [Streptosporangiaceae bacterium]